MSNALLSVWFRPADTLDAVLPSTSGRQIFVLAILSGISISMGQVALHANPADLFHPDVFASLVVIGAPAGLLNVYLAALVFYWTARCFGGTAPQRAVRATVAWSNIPIIACLLPTLAAALTTGSRAGLAILGGLAMILVIWFYTTAVLMLKRLEKFGTGRALATVILGSALCYLPAGALKAFVIQSYVTASNSMLPTLTQDETFLVLKGIFAGSAERGDVVVFRPPSEPGVDYVKRIAGLPGDRIRVSHRVLFVNDQPVHREKMDMADGFIRYRETLPYGRSYEVKDIDGPEGFADNTDNVIVPEGQCFVLGDNRDNSLDSRFSGKIGFIPLGNIVGKVAMIVYARDPRGGIAWERIGIRPR